MKRNWILQTICSVMLIWALNPDNPYEYYTLLKWVCCCVFLYLARKAFKQKQEGWIWILIILALFYNPIFPVHLTREIWTIVNIVTIIIIQSSVFLLPGNKQKKDSSKPLNDNGTNDQ